MSESETEQALSLRKTKKGKTMKEKTCLALFSGGLDSLLSIKLMQNLGFNVIMLNFNTGFFFSAYDKKGNEFVYKAKVPPGFDIHVVDISAEFFEMIKSPKHGFGRNMNPCIDCKILMLRKAKELMPQYDAGFVITGEVLGQRPMTQNARSLKVIMQESGLEGFLLRPLCAKNMPATEPERLGWVERGKLLDLQGRGRTRQLELAEKWGLGGFVKTPGGGCILTDENYSKKLRDLLNRKPETGNRNGAELGTRNLEPGTDFFLLAIGRHFRKDGVKFIVGRKKDENEILLKCKDRATVFDTQAAPGPITVTFDSINNEMEMFIAGVTAGYSDVKTKPAADVSVVFNGNKKILNVRPITGNELKKYRVDL
jgi:tRNA-specific 2-thiouridylase